MLTRGEKKAWLNSDRVLGLRTSSRRPPQQQETTTEDREVGGKKVRE